MFRFVTITSTKFTYFADSLGEQKLKRKKNRVLQKIDLFAHAVNSAVIIVNISNYNNPLTHLRTEKQMPLS